MFSGIRIVAAIVGALVVGCSNQAPNATSSGNAANPGATVTIVGAGSTLDYPFFSRAFYQYSKDHPNVAINYQSIGSGGGIRQFVARTVDFGATDVPMGSTDLAGVPKDRTVIQTPITLGGVAIAYNVPDAPAHLKLSSAVIADMFLGKIGNWSDPRIAGLNPGVTLKSLPIAVVHRADGSGTTYIFTDYLSSISAEWKSRIGTGKTVTWVAPSAIGAKGTEGVAGQIRNTPGAIGYIELAYAMQNDIAFASVQNKAGQFVLPTLETVAAAAVAKPNVSASDFSIVNQGGAHTYPIVGYSWVLLYQHYPDAAKEKTLKSLFIWMLGDAQQLASAIDYPPLPNSASKAALLSLSKLGKM